MNLEDPQWDVYEERFRNLAEQIALQKGPQSELASAQAYLFLYGENALTPEQEFEMLARFEQAPERLKGTSILTSYWEDIVLYLM